MSCRYSRQFLRSCANLWMSSQLIGLSVLISRVHSASLSGLDCPRCVDLIISDQGCSVRL